MFRALAPGDEGKFQLVVQLMGEGRIKYVLVRADDAQAVALEIDRLFVPDRRRVELAAAAVFGHRCGRVLFSGGRFHEMHFAGAPGMAFERHEVAHLARPGQG